MPYESKSELPAAVKKLPKERQAQWLNIFNSALNQAKKAGKSHAEAEETAFKEAWGVIDKEENRGGHKAADAKETKQESHYTDKASNSSRQCGNCEHFQAPHGCSLVQGVISSDGTCDYFDAKSGKKAASKDPFKGLSDGCGGNFIRLLKDGPSALDDGEYQELENRGLVEKSEGHITMTEKGKSLETTLRQKISETAKSVAMAYLDRSQELLDELTPQANTEEASVFVAGRGWITVRHQR